MKNKAYSLVLASAIGAAFLAGWWFNQRTAVVAASPEARVSGRAAAPTYVCPMHPEVVSDRASDCPACGMRLVAGRNRGHLDDGTADGGTGASPGLVRVGTEARRLAGVQVTEVATTSSTHVLRFPGRVAPDETRTHTVTAGIDGFVREVSPVTTGSQVKRGQRLATFSAPDAIPAMQNYVVALHAMDRLRENGAEGAAQAQITSASANFQQRLEKLQDLGMSDAQIADVRRTRQVPDSIRIVSPVDGFVLARAISPGQRFQRGLDWYRIADLGRVWILVEVVGAEADHVRPGMRAQVSLPGRASTFEATVSAVLPKYDPASRALEVRLEAPNPGHALTPDMFVDVEVPIVLPPSIAVPVDAVVDSGRRKTVFVDRGEGALEPREVQTGWRFGDLVQVVEGLAPGERIVTAGAFLIDSESRMRLAQSGVSRTPGAYRKD